MTESVVSADRTDMLLQALVPVRNAQDLCANLPNRSLSVRAATCRLGMPQPDVQGTQRGHSPHISMAAMREAMCMQRGPF